MIYSCIRMCGVFWLWLLVDLCSNEDGTLHIFHDVQSFAVIFSGDRNLKCSGRASLQPLTMP